MQSPSSKLRGSGKERPRVEESPPSEMSADQQIDQVLDNGDRYTGQYLDNEFEGYGKYTYASGEIQYRGYFHKNKPHGAGSLLKLSKDSSVLPFEIYNGDWENGQKHGAGKYNYMRDVFYDGNWSRNQKEGTGILKTEEGEFVGEWKNDKKNGKGELVLKNGNKFAGRWVDDELVEGEVTYSNGDKYKGTLKNMKRHGRGKYTFVNNSVYEGEWIDNCKSGKGEITFANGDEFYGELKQDAFHGNNCNYTWAQGHEIRGRFEDDMPKTGVFKSLGMDDLQFNFTK